MEEKNVKTQITIIFPGSFLRNLAQFYVQRSYNQKIEAKSLKRQA